VEYTESQEVVKMRQFAERKSKGWAAPPGLTEVLLVFAVTFLASVICFHSFKGIFADSLPALVSTASHVPMLLIPLLWYHFRFRPGGKTAQLGHWDKKSLQYLLVIAGWLIPLLLLANMDVIGKPVPPWYDLGMTSIILQIFFQGLFVGFSEEMLMRPVIHQALLAKRHDGFFLFRKVYISAPNLLTAVLFGLLHAGNLGQQPFGYTVMQMAYACVIGVIIGIYYERTRSYIGAAVLHNLIDMTGVIMILIAGKWII
jgi:membrane protease YdiL (CAAX protease family)